MPKISVVMPTFNSEKHLKEAIDSILKQTFGDFELIIVDDLSSDNTKNIVLSYQDSRIRFIENKSKNISKALNIGILNSKGKYIARMDSDDIALPDRLKKQYEFLEKNKHISILGSNVIEISENGDFLKKSSLISNPTIIDALSSCVVCHPTVMLRKKDLNKWNLRYNEQYNAAEDQELWARALLVVNIYNLDDALLKYRKHPKSATIKTKKDGEKNLTYIRNNILKKLISYEFSSNKLIYNNEISYFFSTILLKEKYSLKLLFIIPFITVKRTPKGILYKLLSTITLLRIRIKKDRKTFFLFGIIPVLKVISSQQHKKYLLFNLFPLLKIS